MSKVAASRVDWTFARYLAICFVSALALAPPLQPAYHGKADAMAALVTVFTVLAGFMLAVMALAADGRNLRRKDWRQDTYFLKEIRDRLARYRMMFHLYLLVPALAIVTFIGPAWGEGVQRFAEGFVLFLAIFALLWSFRIPGEITSAHVRQLQAAIKEQRDAEHAEILDSSSGSDDGTGK
ncbi:hypothetical protein IAE60_15540 [Pseudoxanthomonas mexicana]|uniref:Uncharacterized protein n=1 Tax=Pseudoxanthomonas mexicana TaxID=128785 RepID=A0A7G9TB41_PSEMX|nr:hypothetical protein [Pseudoxanthomonas mexicana]QNN77316.1 hypothetical protein IAE60_15540 [Pseudoxanthomonas mexicana]